MHLETTYERHDRQVKRWQDADTVTFLVWCTPDEKEAARKRGERRVAAFLEDHPDAAPAGESGGAFNGEGLAYNGEWILEYRLEKPSEFA